MENFTDYPKSDPKIEDGHTEILHRGLCCENHILQMSCIPSISRPVLCVCVCARAHMYVYVKGLFVNQLIYSKIFSFSTFILHTLTRSSTISSTLDSQMIGHSMLFSMVTNMICRKMLVQIIVLFQCEFRITLCLQSYCKMSSFSVYQTLV